MQGLGFLEEGFGEESGDGDGDADGDGDGDGKTEKTSVADGWGGVKNDEL